MTDTTIETVAAAAALAARPFAKTNLRDRGAALVAVADAFPAAAEAIAAQYGCEVRTIEAIEAAKNAAAKAQKEPK